jgi:hypothetical protein
MAESIGRESKREDDILDHQSEQLLVNCVFRVQYDAHILEGKMRYIDIDSLSEDELIELNHKVVARLRFLSQMRSHSAMLDFRVGERVNSIPTAALS